MKGRGGHSRPSLFFPRFSRRWMVGEEREGGKS